jgi:hypothetical protein
VYCIVTCDNSGTRNRDREGLPTNWMRGLVFSVGLVTGLLAGCQRIDIQFATWTETCLFTVGRGLSLGLIERHVHCQLGFLRSVWFESNHNITGSWGTVGGITYKTSVYFQFYLTHIEGYIYLR